MHTFLFENNVLKTLRTASLMRQSFWDPENKIDLQYRAVELGGEVGELLNKIKKLSRERLGLRGSRTSTSEIAEELGDIIICVDLVAMLLRVDLWPEVVKKFNADSKKYNLPVVIEDNSTIGVSNGVSNG